MDIPQFDHELCRTVVVRSDLLFLFTVRKRVLAAVKEIQRQEPREGEAVNLARTGLTVLGFVGWLRRRAA